MRPVTNTTGLISRQQALDIARADYSPPDPDAKLDIFLLEATASATIGSDAPVRDRAVWIARYSNLEMTTPGGHVLHYLYNIFDAATGQFLLGTGK